MEMDQEKCQLAIEVLKKKKKREKTDYNLVNDFTKEEADELQKLNEFTKTKEGILVLDMLRLTDLVVMVCVKNEYNTYLLDRDGWSSKKNYFVEVNKMRKLSVESIFFILPRIKAVINYIANYILEHEKK